MRNIIIAIFFVLLSSSGFASSDKNQTYEIFKEILNDKGSTDAKNYLIQEIQKNNITAIHLLAKVYIDGKVVNKNIPLAVEVLKKGVELKDSKSAFALGNFYSDGNYIAPDLKKAQSYYQLAFDFGDEKAKTVLENQFGQEVIINNQNSGQAYLEEDNTNNSTGSDNSVNQVSVYPKGYSNKSLDWIEDEIDLYQISKFGSGFAISENGLIATNEHVIYGCQKIFVVYQSKQRLAKIINKSKKDDFAVIKVNENTPSFFFFKSDLPEIGENLISGGFPSPMELGFGIKITTGVVSSENFRFGEIFQHSTPSQPGNSGGPLINLSGQIVGLSTAVYGEQIGDLQPQNINYAVSNYTATELLKKWNIPYKVDNSNMQFEAKDLAKYLKSAAAQIICY